MVPERATTLGRSDDRRALARAISAAERDDPAAGTLATPGDPAHAPGRLVGLTGPPGSGKSTLADTLVTAWRSAQLSVAVLAVDPSSPFTGGALLGDRVRMQGHAADPSVFIRSMGARGHLGGLAAAARSAVRLLEAERFDRILLETVGVGQSELEVSRVADTVVVVTTPAAGDGVQVMKAGIMEIGDIFVVNKADLDGADRTVREIRGMVRAGTGGDGWTPPVLASVATRAGGVTELVAALDRHHAHLVVSAQLERRRQGRLVDEVVALVARRAEAAARQLVARDGLPLAGGNGSAGPEAAIDPVRIAERLLGRLTAPGPDPSR